MDQGIFPTLTTVPQDPCAAAPKGQYSKPLRGRLATSIIHDAGNGSLVSCTACHGHDHGPTIPGHAASRESYKGDDPLHVHTRETPSGLKQNKGSASTALLLVETAVGLEAVHQDLHLLRLPK